MFTPLAVKIDQSLIKKNLRVNKNMLPAQTRISTYYETLNAIELGKVYRNLKQLKR